eukprot:m.188666 g.188666  ORF g.188666 m.188666 type:complete len:470 (-) comp15424_c0_seq18:34-1443(-)
MWRLSRRAYSAAARLEMIADSQASDVKYLKQIFVRDQMAEWSKAPLLMAKADGVHYWDVDGKHYWDALSGIYTTSVGHNNERVKQAIRGQLEVLHFSPPMHGTNPIAVRLADIIKQISPGDLAVSKFECSGSEVTEAAIKFARQYHRLTGNPGKYKIISRYQSWHGSTMASLSASGLKSRKTVNEPLAAGFVKVFPPTCYRCPFGKEYRNATCGVTCATITDDVIAMEDPATVAAVLVEPIGHTGGIIDPPQEYLRVLREICTRNNILLIFDEVITGIGRTGHMFAADTFGVVPDVICTGKGLSGGYIPISAMIASQRFADAFWGDPATNPGFVEGHTFEGSPLAAAAAVAVLQEVCERDLCGNARAMGARLRKGFENIARKHGVVGDIRGKGLFLAMEFVRDPATKTRFPDNPAFGTMVGRRALQHGLLCRFDPHWIAFGPALTVTAEEIDAMVGILDTAIGETLATL